MSLSRPVLPLMAAAARPGAASLTALAARRIQHRSALTTTLSKSNHALLRAQHFVPAALRHQHSLYRSIHTHHRTSLSPSPPSSLLSTSTSRLSPLSPRSSTSLSSLPHSTSLQPSRPFTQLIIATVVVLTAGYFIRKTYRAMRAMRPDLQSEPLDPSKPGVQYHEGGFADKMDRAEAALILGVRDNASKEKIMERYRQLMKVNHPDLGGSPYVSTKINEAKELLSKTARSEAEHGDRRGRRYKV